MARTDDLTNFLVDVAAAIKTKKGSQTDIPAANFDTEIASINTVNNQNKTITPTTSQQTITADQGYTGIGTATVNAVTSSIDQNIVTGNIKKDVTILGVTGTFEGAEDLTSVLNAQDQKIAELETALENKTAGGGDGSSLNVFVQLTEPATKKGLWLQANKTVTHITKGDIGQWLPSGTYSDIPYAFYAGGAAAVGDNVYLFGGTNNGIDWTYEYDTLTDTYTRKSNIPYLFASGLVAVVGTNIYLFGNINTTNAKKACKYNTLTDTYTQLTDVPVYAGFGAVAVVGTDIYLFGGARSGTGSNAHNNTIKYNTLTDTYTTMATIPTNFYYGSAAAVGTDIYLLGNRISGYQNKNYKYDTLTDTYTQMTDIPYDFYMGSAVAIGTNIYLISSNDDVNCFYKYSTSTDMYIPLIDIPYDSFRNSVVAIGSNIWLFGGMPETSNNKVQVYSLTSTGYENNSVIIYDGSTYSTELFSNPISEIQYKFATVDYYGTQYEEDLPTYYGNGTQWINIKNPPQNNNNNGGEE